MGLIDKQKIGTHDDHNIKGFYGEFDFLSNFYQSTVTIDGYAYLSSEAAYQAAKCKNKKDKLQFVGIQANTAKQLGRRIELRPDWEAVKLQVMEDLVRAKFAQNKSLADKLVSTGNKYLEETNYWNDTYWGVCKGKGNNNLGKILMKIRTELQKV
jgi:ribA/ribD-fused uncharacterized protein